MLNGSKWWAVSVVVQVGEGVRLGRLHSSMADAAVGVGTGGFDGGK